MSNVFNVKCQTIFLIAEDGTVVIELMPDSEPEGEESRDAFEEVVVVKKRGRGRPRKIKEEDIQNSGIT